MSFKRKYPDYAAIEAHIHRARVERAVVISQGILRFVEAAVRGGKMVFQAVAAGIKRRAARPNRPVAEY